MGLTVNNITTLSLLNILNRTSTEQQNVLYRMATGNKINRGADDPAGLLAITSLDSELTAVNAGIQSNQRTDALLGVADGALSQIGSLLEDIQSLANQSSNDAGLTADELAANQAQIDDAIASIDRLVANTQFNGLKLLDGSLAINTTVGTAGAITDVKVYSRRAGGDDTTLTVQRVSAADHAEVTSVMTTSTSEDTTFSVQGKLGTAVITALSTENVSSVAAKINDATAQTGVSAVMSGVILNLYSTDTGANAFVRTKLIDGSGVAENSDYGTDAVVNVNGQRTAVDGEHVAYTANGISVSFELGTLTSTVVLTIKGNDSGNSGATFQLGTTSDTRATLGVDGLYSAQLGNTTEGYLKSLVSGGGNSLLDDPAQAAAIARVAASQVATLRGRVGGFQKFQVQTSLNSLNDTKEALEKARSVINDVDYAAETAELNRQNILMQSAISLLGVASQQSAQVLSLLR
jgi:flagellin